MNPEQEFNRRMAALHGLGRSPETLPISEEGATMDIRHAEFEALADSFLGADFDGAKRKQVEDLQVALHVQQAALYSRLQHGELNADKYVDASNALIEETFRNCEEVLGADDFEKLFGATRDELKELIDREAFLKAHRHE